MTWCKEDFVSSIKPINTQVNGIGSGLKAKGIGTVEWTFRSTTGKLTALYAPQMTVFAPSPTACIRAQHIN